MLFRSYCRKIDLDAAILLISLLLKKMRSASSYGHFTATKEFRSKYHFFVVGHWSRQETKIYEFNVPLSVLVLGGKTKNMTCHALEPNVKKSCGHVTKEYAGRRRKQNMDGAGPEFFFDIPVRNN